MIRTCVLAGCIATAVFCAPLAPAYAAAYLLSSNAADAQSRIVADLQSSVLDTTNLAPDVPAKTLAFLSNAPPLTKAVLQSALRRICPVLSVDNDYGRQYAFRSIHALGKIDWIVSASAAAPETITSISFMMNNGKPPAILPILPPEGETSILPSVEMGCSNEEERKAAEQEIKQACEQLGASCGLKVK